MTFTFTEPPLSTGLAHLLSGWISASYVISLYIAQVTQIPGQSFINSRNDPRVIKVRLFAASCATVTSCIVVFCAIWSSIPENVEYRFWMAIDSTYSRLAFPTEFSVKPHYLKQHLIVPLLFTGPLYGHYLSSTLPFQRHFNIRRNIISVLSDWRGLRDYIIGPLTEEITYRSCVLSVMQLAGFSKTTMVFLSPCWFGLAHIHHGYSNYHRLGRNNKALVQAVTGALFQFTYTTVFGWLCSYMFLRTSSLAVTLFAHIFCNVMGVPQLTSELRANPQKKLHIWTAYICGVIAFALTLRPWTKNKESFYWPDISGAY